jgi:hypothetical protein
MASVLAKMQNKHFSNTSLELYLKTEDRLKIQENSLIHDLQTHGKAKEKNWNNKI